MELKPQESSSLLSMTHKPVSTIEDEGSFTWSKLSCWTPVCPVWNPWRHAILRQQSVSCCFQWKILAQTFVGNFHWDI